MIIDYRKQNEDLRKIINDAFDVIVVYTDYILVGPKCTHANKWIEKNIKFIQKMNEKPTPKPASIEGGE